MTTQNVDICLRDDPTRNSAGDVDTGGYENNNDRRCPHRRDDGSADPRVGLTGQVWQQAAVKPELATAGGGRWQWGDARHILTLPLSFHV